MDLQWLLLSPSGRLNRKPYWLTFLAFIGIEIVVQIIAAVLNAPAINLALLVLVVPGVMMGIKRLHDRGRSGWFYLLLAVPLLNLWPAIEMLFLPGTPGPNQYGPDPLNPVAGAPYPA